jgi:hypothetical protein
MAPWRTVICVTGSPDDFSSSRILEVGRIADTVDQEVQEPFGRQQALAFEFLDRLVAHRHIAAADVKHHVIVLSFADALES